MTTDIDQVSTKEFIDAAREICILNGWCAAAEMLISKHTGLVFKKRTWDDDKGHYRALTLEDDQPETLSRVAVRRLSQAVVSQGYTMRDYPELREFFRRFDILPVTYENDRWVVTVELTTDDMLQSGFIPDEVNQLPKDDIKGAVYRAVRHYTPLERYKVTYIPDPARAEPTDFH